ncbi:hypothetical protein [Kingella oralis]|jgi:hypothetical protein|uniref:hypothetical protein n=1 Tax=Kingella oralis TaxID=505 RepID=UPI002D7F961B|nr:hypothetical protein [Kingella oralis]
MFSYLITAIAVVLCLLGALAIFGNFGALLAAQRSGKSTSFVLGIGAVLWCLGIYCIPKRYAISGYWYAVALLDIGVWVVIASIFCSPNESCISEADSPFKRVAQFTRDGHDEHYCLSFYRNGEVVLTYLKSNESGYRAWYWEKMDNVWHIRSRDGNQITANQQGDKLVFANHAEGQQNGMFEHIIGQTFIQQAIQAD